MIRAEAVEPKREHTPPVGVKWHEYADIFPWIEGEAFRALVEDVRKNGVLEPIVFLDGAVLDGRNRYMAARELGIEYPRVEYEGDDPLGFVISHNLTRRHLTESQRGMVGTRLATMKQGRPGKDANLQVSREAAAKMLNVSERTIATASKVQERGAPELVAAVETGKVSVSAAAELSTLPVEKQIEALKESNPKAFQKVVKAARAEGQAAKKAKRVEREIKTGDRIRALPTKRYGVIYADPEWHDEVWSEETGMDRHAANHYSTSGADVIGSRPVGTIAAPDCFLALWTTNQHLRIALAVLEAWGFEYKSNYVWGKDKIGMGRWNRSKHEILLIGTRGKVPCPSPGTQWESLQLAPVGEHSAKPELFAEMIDQYFPTIPKIELNRRGPARPGWDAWGLEAEEQNLPSGAAASAADTPAVTLLPIAGDQSAEVAA